MITTMRKISSLFMLVMMALVWTSCKEDEPKVVTKTYLLTAHTWKLTGFRIDPPIIIEGPEGTVEFSDLYAADECWHDNTITFSADGNFSGNEGANNCSEEDPAVSTGTWSFNTTETSIIIDAEDDTPLAATIEDLTETTFEISQEMTIDELQWTGKAYLTFGK